MMKIICGNGYLRSDRAAVVNGLIMIDCRMGSTFKMPFYRIRLLNLGTIFNEKKTTVWLISRNHGLSIKAVIMKLREDLIEGESLKGYAAFKKIRTGKYRLIYTLREDVLLIAIIEKRETVYATFEHLFKKSSMFDD